MEVSLQTNFVLEQQHTRRRLKPSYIKRDNKDSQNSNNSVELPSIRRNHRIFDSIPESPRLKLTDLVSPTRFPSIFKKYQPNA